MPLQHVRRFRRCPQILVRCPAGAIDAIEARGPLARALGLAGLRGMPAGALLLRRCRSVHTVGMRFPIDVVFLAAGRVAEVRPAVGRSRIASVRGARHTLELAAGEAERLGLRPGAPVQSTSGATAAGAGRTNTRAPIS